MTTPLRYRGDDGQPCCEVTLENGDRVLIAVDARGVTIRQLARLDATEEVLFLGPVHLVAEICSALVDARPASETTVLDIFLAVVSQFRSANDIRAAFSAATAPRT